VAHGTKGKSQSYICDLRRASYFGRDPTTIADGRNDLDAGFFWLSLGAFCAGVVRAIDIVRPLAREVLGGLRSTCAMRLSTIGIVVETLEGKRSGPSSRASMRSRTGR